MFPAVDHLEISVDEAAALLGSPEYGESVRLIDCREEVEFEWCRIEGAEWIPLSRFPEEAGRKLLPENEADPDSALLIYCHHGVRSLQATDYLRQLGIEKVWSMTGGIDAWSCRIDPQIPRY